MGSVDGRKLLTDAVVRWERWAAAEMLILEYLHPRAKARLLDELQAALEADEASRPPRGKREKAG